MTRVFTAAAALLGCAVLPATAAAPSMSSSWVTIEITQDECVKQASAAVKRQGFGTNFEALGNSTIYGEHGNYTVLVRCAADKKIVFFVVAGPKVDQCSRSMNAIKDDF